MKKASMGGRSFNRVSQMPVLKKVRKRDTMVSLLFYFLSDQEDNPSMIKRACYLFLAYLQLRSAIRTTRCLNRNG
jgi:hypothetical protein